MLDKFDTNEKIFVGGGALLLIASFLPWHSVDLGPFGDVNRSGWQSPSTPWSLLAVIIGVGLAGLLAAQKLTQANLPDQVKMGDRSFGWNQIFMAGGIAVAALVVIKLLDESDFLGFGFYIAVVAAAGQAYAGVMMGRASKPSAPPSAPPPPPPV